MARLVAAELTTERNFRAQCEQFLSVLAAKGEPAKYGSTIRTLAEQREMVRRGVSKTMKSAHVGANYPDGLSRAADIVHKTKGWGASRRFWLMLGHLARTKGLNWGGLYGLSKVQKQRMVDAIESLAKAGWPTDKDVEPIRKRLHTGKPVNPDEMAKVQAMRNYDVARGWDPAHVSLEKSNWT